MRNFIKIFIAYLLIYILIKFLIDLIIYLFSKYIKMLIIVWAIMKIPIKNKRDTDLIVTSSIILIASLKVL